MLNKVLPITFVATKRDMVEVWPHPKPSHHYVPEEYKKLERFVDKDLHKATLKTCIPFLEAMTAGYIIPFDQDYVVDSLEKDFSVMPANREPGEVDYHSDIQIPKEWHQLTGSHAGKFINKWVIKTPPGYSCLFTHPMNRFKEQRYRIIDGIVDTDTYVSVINFPFIMLEKNTQFLIKKGDPMIQVIPFKRQSWKKWSGFYFEKLHSATDNLLNSKWFDRYRKMFWHKKSFR